MYFFVFLCKRKKYIVITLMLTDAWNAVFYSNIVSICECRPNHMSNNNNFKASKQMKYILNYTLFFAITKQWHVRNSLYDICPLSFTKICRLYLNEKRYSTNHNHICTILLIMNQGNSMQSPIILCSNFLIPILVCHDQVNEYNINSFIDYYSINTS